MKPKRDYSASLLMPLHSLLYAGHQPTFGFVGNCKCGGRIIQYTIRDNITRATCTACKRTEVKQ